MASGKKTTRIPAIQTNVPRTASTTCEIGLTFTNACSQPGIDFTATNVLLANVSGSTSSIITPWTDPALRIFSPTQTEIQANDSAKQIDSPIAASSDMKLVSIRKPRM